MCDNIKPSFITLPVELIYRILDQLDEFAILSSVCNVCERLNSILDTYNRYKVKFSLIVKNALGSHV